MNLQANYIEKMPQIRPAWPRSDRMGKKESQKALRECVRRNPESDLHSLAEKLGWSLGKTNAVISSIRAEFTQGYVLKESIKHGA